MNYFLPNIAAKMYNNAPINGARYVYVGNPDDPDKKRLEAVEAGVVPPEGVSSNAHDEAVKARAIAAETGNAAKEASKVPEEDKAKESKKTSNQAAPTLAADPSTKEEVPQQSSTKQKGAIRKIADAIFVYPYWLVTKGIQQKLGNSRLGQWGKKMKQKEELLFRKTMAKANFPWFPVKAAYWLAREPLRYTWNGAAGVIGWPGKKLMPDVSNPYKKRKSESKQT